MDNSAESNNFNIFINSIKVNDKIDGRDHIGYNNIQNTIKADLDTQNLNKIWNGFKKFIPQTNIHILRTNNEINVYYLESQEYIMTILIKDVFSVIDKTNCDVFTVIRELIESENDLSNALANLSNNKT